MVSSDLPYNFVGIIGNVISISLFLSPVPTLYKIWKKKAVESYSPIPYLVTFVNCGVWFFYGLPLVHPHSLLVTTTSGAGSVIESVYILVFIIYSTRDTRNMVLLVLVGEVIFLAVLVIVVLTVTNSMTIRSAIVGGIGIAGSIAMYASPLSVWKLVIATRNVEYMPFLLSLFSFASSICWFSYALIRFDPYIAVPNGLGVLFGLVQLIIYACYYKSTQEIIANRQMGEVSFGNVATSSNA